MRSPDSFLVGVNPSEIIEIKLADVLKFHGYCAGGVAFSFRAAQEAFRILYGDTPPIRQNLRVQTSHHCCQAGALAYITGARTDFGAISNRGDLVLLPEDSKRIVFIDKKTGGKVELRPRFNPHDIFTPLFQKVRKDPGLAPQVQKTLNEAVHEYLSVQAEKLFLFA
jgi:formylmethanofuran dehydrogenase subunit E